MRQEAKLRRKQTSPARIHDVVHPDVVPGDVARGVGVGLGIGEVHRRRDPLREPLRQPGFRPLPARPALALLQPLVEGGEGKVEEDHESELVGEQVVAQVSAGIVGGERLVEGLDRPDVQVRLAP